MGAIVNALYGTPLDTGIDPMELARLSIFWEQVGFCDTNACPSLSVAVTRCWAVSEL